RGAALWGSDTLQTLATIQVQSTTIDRYCQENEIERIDILKLDIQGGELKALEGAVTMLGQNKIQLIYTEILIIPTYKAQPSFEDYLRFLQKLGYTMLDVYYPVRKDYKLLQ